MRTELLWRLTALAGLAAALVLLAGLVHAVGDVLNPPADGMDRPAGGHSGSRDEKETDPDGHLDIVALGDSLTAGMGDQTGLGYVGRVRNRLTEAGYGPVRLLNNLAVNGYRTDQLLADLDKPSVAASVRNADLILFTIGGNDLFQSFRAGMDARPETMPGDGLKKAIPEPAERLGRIFERLAAIRPEALIVYVGLYNPFADLDETGETSAAVAEWNAIAGRLANRHPNVLMVPVADLFERHPGRYLYTDHFHPNAQGYERIAERVFRALE